MHVAILAYRESRLNSVSSSSDHGINWGII